MDKNKLYITLGRLEDHLRSLPDEPYRDALFHDFQNLIMELLSGQKAKYKLQEITNNKEDAC